MDPNTPKLNRRSFAGLLAAAGLSPAVFSNFADSADRQTDADQEVETIRTERVGRYATGEFDGGAEIVAYDTSQRRLFVVNSEAAQVEVLDISDPAAPVQDAVLNASELVAANGTVVDSVGGTNSVDVHNGTVAAAIEADPATDDGAVAFYDAASLEFRAAVTVGPLPDKITIGPDGNTVVVANEGEPGDATDPAGSVSVIDIADGVESAAVSTATFDRFDGLEDLLRSEGVHLAAPGDEDVSLSTVTEPEFVSISPDAERAYVSLQENNAIATVDLGEGVVERIDGLGFKDFSLPGNELDTSDADGISLQGWPLLGMYQPDAIASYEVGGQTFVVTANEGDAKDFEVSVLKNLELDPSGFALSENPYVDSVEELKEPKHLGNMEVNEAAMQEFADDNGDGAYTDIYAIGGRSFSIWQQTDEGLRQVFDSGNQFERTYAQQFPAGFQNSVESGPETESVELGTIGDRTYAFVGIERGSGIFVYDVTNPVSPEHVQTVVNRDFSVGFGELAGDAESNPDSDSPGRAGDWGPEGIEFIPAADSPVETPLLAVGYEVSGTVSVFRITPERGD